MSRIETVSAAVLLGGASTRMGRDKARVQLAGVALGARVAGVLDALFGDVMLVGGDPPPGAPGRVVADPPGPRCALRGLVAALDAARGEEALVVATDLALVTPELLLALAAWPARAAVVPRDANGAQPLCALYRREPVLAVARRHLAAGRLALHELLDAVEVGWLEGEDLAAVDPDGRALHNVNTPDDLARAERELGPAGSRADAQA